MEVVNTSQLRFAPLVSLVEPGKYEMTLIVKGSFDLILDGPLQLSKHQAFATGEQHYDDAQEQSLLYESDFVPFKPNADLLLVGKCYTPGGKPLRMCEVTYRVGEWSKSLNVHGNRFWTSEHGLIPKITEAEPFVEMPLRYENSFGGPGNLWNPLGKGSSKEKIAGETEQLPLPNIENVKNPINAFLDRPKPAGFGPLDRAWRERHSKIGTYDDQWKNERWPCLPTDFDPSFYNAAPSDAQLPGYLRGDEELEFVNLHPVHSAYRSRLPGLRVRLFLNEEANEGDGLPVFREISANLDTLAVDMDRERAYLNWRGKSEIQTDDYREITHVFIHVEDLATKPLSTEECRAIFEHEIADAGVSGLAGIALPDVDDIIAKVEKKAAQLVAHGFAAETVNSQLDPQLNVVFPDLSQMSLDEQRVAIDVFGTSALIASDALVESKKKEARDGMVPAGQLEKELEASNAAAQKQHIQLLTELGVDKDMQLLNVELKQTGKALHRLGVDLGQSADVAASLCGGLEGFGLANSIPGLELGDDEPELTRVTIPAKVAAGESFEGVLIRGVDLSGLNLRSADFRDVIFLDTSLEGTDLSGADLRGAIFCGANLGGAKLVDANCEGTNFARANLENADLTGSTLTNANFEKTQAARAKFEQVSAEHANFLNADLSHAKLSQADFSEADFTKCELSNATFRRSSLSKCTFNEAFGEGVDFTAANLAQARASLGCRFPGANFHQTQAAESNWSGADLSQADFSFSTMPGSFFVGASLVKANMQAAGLRQARFSKANLTSAKMVDCDLYQAAFDAADISHADLSGANAFEANFFGTVRNLSLMVGTNLKQTLLA